MSEPSRAIPITVADAIGRHRQAYAISTAALDRVQAMRVDFDPELQFESEIEIDRALAAHYGHRSDAMGRDYRASIADATATAEAEDAAWLAFSSMVPTTPDEVDTWMAYVIEHSAKQDEVVNLRDALVHVCGLLAERPAGSSTAA